MSVWGGGGGGEVAAEEVRHGGGKSFARVGFLDAFQAAGHVVFGSFPPKPGRCVYMMICSGTIVATAPCSYSEHIQFKVAALSHRGSDKKNSSL